MPGSNPLFGLNTLGGALSIQTKDGRSFPGTTMRAIYGSDVRRAVEFEHGGSRASGLHWYLAGNLFADNGWRDASPSRVGQLFGKVGRHDAKHDTALSVGYADNALNGSALQEQRLLARDYASVYTKPDETDNRSTFVNLTTRNDRSRRLTLSGNALPRHPDQRVQRRHQRRLARSSRVSTERGGEACAGGRRLRRVSDQRRDGGQHAVSGLALHRQRPAQRRARRKMQRAAEPRGQRATQRRLVGAGDTARLARATQHADRRRRLRPQPLGVPPVDGAWLPQSRSQCDRTECLRRRGRGRKRRRGAIR
jgi:hypothetical protein